ncbi:hypothetical protein GQ43DRAFT_470318 [Delitschia confertaspora ATCC 74209]|uniref:NACHT domain-containing protein n=1 Tax=Delitschia confertaspora ATCC 74209 TaxID=1513339 RepID=A0A9P4MXD8_9PLEO|nr:hypothetical protein GQ43DRAFT_470318 [Delitschia confertaspora ATCC 74209]
MTAKSDITVKELGFTLLSNPADPQADVFFVHGLQGHPRATWASSSSDLQRNQSQARKQGFRERLTKAFRTRSAEDAAPGADTGVYWPSDLLRQSFPKLRIFTYGYDSHVTHWFKGPAMQLDIFSYGESLLLGLVSRRTEDAQRPLIFVVHSLGGLIIKEVLRRARGSTDPRFKNIYLATTGIVFFGTPHHGGNYTNIGLTARKIVAASGFDASQKVLRDLKFDSSVAKMLSEEFTQFLDERKPVVYTFQEASGLSGFGPLSGKVVDDFSSSLEYPLQFKDHIYANHMNICRFSGPEDDGYEKVHAAFIHILSGDIQRASQAHGIYPRVLESLFLPDHEERLNQVEPAHKGTFEWLYQDRVPFIQWLKAGNGIFWISGKPASGKSTLLKFAVSDTRTYEHLHENNSINRWITGDFFFTNRGKQEQRCVEGLLQRILFQLLSQSKELLPFIERIFKEHADHHGWLLIYLEDALKKIIEQRKVPINICLFVDALDEQSEGYYQNHATLLNYLRSLVERADGKTVRLLLCLTSRPENIFVDCLRGYPGFRIHEHTQGDIDMYVNNRIAQYVSSRPDLGVDPNNTAFFRELCSQVCRRAEGVFLWVKLVVTDIIEGLRDGDPPNALQRKLDTLPGDGDLQQLYSGILLRLPPNYLHEAYIMLWIAYSSNEPVPLSEFFQAKDLMMQGDADYNWATPTVRQMELQLLSRCRGFLEIQYSFTRDEQGREYSGPFAQFLHLSVKDFLRESDGFDTVRETLKVRFPRSKALEENGHAYLLRYRVAQHFRKYGNDPHQITTLPSFDLRKFDVLYHAYMVEMTLGRPVYEPLDALAHFADSYNLTTCYLRHRGWQAPVSWQPTFLVLCVQAGLLMYVEHTLANKSNLQTLPGRPLLHYAVFPVPESLSQGRTDPFLATSKMIRLLIRYGADVHREFESLTALAFAFQAFYGRGTRLGGSQHLIIETLLRDGASPEVQTRPPREPLAGAVRDNGQLVTPLQMAVQKDDQGTVELLLKYDASIDSLDEDDWIALRKGYIYGDKCPYADEERSKKWWADRDRAIKEGRNKKPMLRLIERYMNMPRRNRAGWDRTNIPVISPKMPPRLNVEPAFGPHNTSYSPRIMKSSMQCSTGSQSPERSVSNPLSDWNSYHSVPYPNGSSSPFNGESFVEPDLNRHSVGHLNASSQQYTYHKPQMMNWINADPHPTPHLHRIHPDLQGQIGAPRSYPLIDNRPRSNNVSRQPPSSDLDPQNRRRLDLPVDPPYLAHYDISRSPPFGHSQSFPLRIRSDPGNPPIPPYPLD